MRASGGDGFEVEARWKEEVVYWEGDRGFLFDAGWGVQPPVVYVPDSATWNDAVPGWLRNRREQVVARLREHSRHALVAVPRGYVGSVPRELRRDDGRG